MKKIIIAACMALLGCGSVFAQQGKQAIGGNLSYGTEIESCLLYTSAFIFLSHDSSLLLVFFYSFGINLDTLTHST